MLVMKGVAMHHEQSRSMSSSWAPVYIEPVNSVLSHQRRHITLIAFQGVPYFLVESVEPYISSAYTATSSARTP